MTDAQPLPGYVRVTHYQLQNSSRRLTPRQLRRVKKKGGGVVGPVSREFLGREKDTVTV